MPFRTIVVALASLFSASALAEEVASKAESQTTAVFCANAFDARTGKLSGETTLIIDQGRIQSVQAGRSAPAGMHTIDLAGMTCLPGLIDMHTHITGATSSHGSEEGFRLNPADYALRARRMRGAPCSPVYHGAQSRRWRNVSIALRNAIDQGLSMGRASSAPEIAGHHRRPSDPTNGRNWELKAIRGKGRRGQQ